LLGPKKQREADLAGGLALSRKDEATGAGRGTDGKRTTGERIHDSRKTERKSLCKCG
jgi:hypothetical protein